MTAQEFVDIVRIHIRDAAANDAIAIALEPPGRRPAQELVDLSNWYNKLGSSDQSYVQRIVVEAANAATFGFLCALDGSRAVEQPGSKGRFELRYIAPTGEITTLEDGVTTTPLHELY